MPRAIPLCASALMLAALPAASCFGAGASVPFTTYEAEAGSVGGGAAVISMTSPPTSTTSTPEYEASGRSYVQIDATGEYVQWTNVRAANQITIRSCIPDSSGGGGTTASIALYVRPVGSSTFTFRQNINLTSKYNWLYGVAGENGQSNTPSSGTAHVYWDDLRSSITTPILQGEAIRLQKDSGNTAAFYRIDLVDLETSPGAVAKPANSIDVTLAPYNVVPNDGANDASGIQSAINAAAAANPKQIVWVPSGVFNLSSTLDVKGVTIQGRGHWNTRFVVAGNVRGFKLNNSGAKVRDVALFNETNTTRSTTTYGIEGVAGVTTNWAVENCWIQHTGTGLWMSGCNNGVVRNNRIYNTYADAINLNRGSSSNLVEHNYVRGNGDDGVAVLSDTIVPTISVNNTVRFNSVHAVWWGANMALRGGNGHVFEDNYLADSTSNPALSINIESAFSMNPITGANFRRNVLVRGGGNKAGQKRGAIWIYTGNKNITGLAFSDTTITNPLFRGVLFSGNSGFTNSTTFTNTTITMSNANENAVYASGSGLTGTSTFTTGNITGGLATEFFDNAANFTLTSSGF